MPRVAVEEIQHRKHTPLVLSSELFLLDVIILDIFLDVLVKLMTATTF